MNMRLLHYLSVLSLLAAFAPVAFAELRPGEVAVSKDRKRTYLCCWVPDQSRNDCYPAIIDLANPTDQYIHKTDLDQPVKIIPIGDRFVVTV